MPKKLPDRMDLADVVAAAMAGSIWKVASLAEEPEIQLRQWSIRRDTDGASYFVGVRTDEHTGRVSTSVVTFDPKLLRGSTMSGRIYELIGPPGVSPDSEYVWEQYKRINELVEVEGPEARLM